MFGSTTPSASSETNWAVEGFESSQFGEDGYLIDVFGKAANEFGRQVHVG